MIWKENHPLKTLKSDVFYGVCQWIMSVCWLWKTVTTKLWQFCVECNWISKTSLNVKYSGFIWKNVSSGKTWIQKPQRWWLAVGVSYDIIYWKRLFHRNWEALWRTIRETILDNMMTRLIWKKIHFDPSKSHFLAKWLSGKMPVLAGHLVLNANKQKIKLSLNILCAFILHHILLYDG